MQWTLPGGRPLELHPAGAGCSAAPDDKWQVIWEPALVHEEHDQRATGWPCTRLTGHPGGGARRGRRADRRAPAGGHRRCGTAGGRGPAPARPGPGRRVQGGPPADHPAVDVSDLPAAAGRGQTRRLRRGGHPAPRGVRPDQAADLRPARHPVPRGRAQPRADPRVRPRAARLGRPGHRRGPRRQPRAVRRRRPGRPRRPAGPLRRAAARRRRRRRARSTGPARTAPSPTGTELFRQEPAAGAAVRTTLDVADPERRRRGPARRDSGAPRWSRSGSATARSSPPPTAPAPPGENLAFTAQVPPGLDVQDGQHARPARRRAR